MDDGVLFFLGSFLKHLKPADIWRLSVNESGIFLCAWIINEEN